MATRPPPDKSTRGLSDPQAQRTQPWQGASSEAGHSSCFLSIPPTTNSLQRFKKSRAWLIPVLRSH